MYFLEKCPKAGKCGFLGVSSLIVEIGCDVAWFALSREENILYLIPAAAVAEFAAASAVSGSCFSMSATNWSILPCTVWLMATTTEFMSRVLTFEVLVTAPAHKEAPVRTFIN